MTSYVASIFSKNHDYNVRGREGERGREREGEREEEFSVSR